MLNKEFTLYDNFNILVDFELLWGGSRSSGPIKPEITRNSQ